MATLQDVQTEIATLKTLVIDKATADQNQIKDLQGQVATLEAQIAGGSASAADLDGVVTSLKDVEAAVSTPAQ